VRVEIGRRKGKITVEFASVADLERIVAVMAPQLATQRGEPAAQPEPNDP
jgi:ParB family chromosome partitioning protein